MLDAPAAAPATCPAEYQELFQQANATRLAGDPRGALKLYSQLAFTALKNQHALPQVWGMASIAARDLGLDEEAHYLLRHAELFAPNDPLVLFNLAGVCRNIGLFDQAKQYALKAAEADPDDKIVNEIGFGAAHSLLQLGDWANGWKYFARRKIELKTDVAKTVAPWWHGRQLSQDETLLIWREQGIGEEIVASSVYHEAIKLAPRLVIMCHKRMRSLFQRSFPSANVCLEYRGPVDYQFPASSLPQLFRQSEESFPKQRKSWLTPDPERVAHYRAKYYDGRPLVGLSWQSRGADFTVPMAEQNQNTMDVANYKSIRPDEMALITDHPGFKFVSLQYHDEQSPLQLPPNVHHDDTVNPCKTDMLEVAAQTAAMDYVISSSSTCAHLAGALGVRTWVIVPFSRGLLWHWMVNRSDSPWYPSVSIERQRRGEKTYIGAVCRARELWLKEAAKSVS